MKSQTPRTTVQPTGLRLRPRRLVWSGFCSPTVLALLFLLTTAAAFSSVSPSRHETPVTPGARSPNGILGSSFPPTLGTTPRRLQLPTTSRGWSEPVRQVGPPFPDGLCGGTVVTIPPSETYGIDVGTSGNEFLLPPRDISVWLPPGYDGDSERQSATQRYPVLYCHDGQNAVLDQDSWTGRSWRLAGALTRLQEHGKLSTMPIVVLLPSADGDLIPGVVRRRHLEYGDGNTPWAQAHGAFVTYTVKPVVDAMFRTYTTAQDTAAIGTSLGGQASLQLMLQYPDTFGAAACLSPAFGPNTLATVATSSKLLQSKKLYMDIGGDMDQEKVPWLDFWDHLTPHHAWNPGYWWLDTQLQPNVRALKTVLDVAQIPHSYHEVPGGRHNERAWSQRIHKPLLHLYGK